MRELQELLHLLCCTKPHAMNMEDILDRDENVCYFYVERDIAGGDGLPNHLEWEMEVAKFKNSMGFMTEEATLDFIRDCIKLSHEIYKVTSGLEERELFLRALVRKA